MKINSFMCAFLLITHYSKEIQLEINSFNLQQQNTNFIEFSCLQGETTQAENFHCLSALIVSWGLQVLPELTCLPTTFESCPIKTCMDAFRRRGIP